MLVSLFPLEFFKSYFLKNETLGQNSGHIEKGTKPDCHVLERPSPQYVTVTTTWQ